MLNVLVLAMALSSTGAPEAHPEVERLMSKYEKARIERVESFRRAVEARDTRLRAIEAGAALRAELAAGMKEKTRA